MRFYMAARLQAGRELTRGGDHGELVHGRGVQHGQVDPVLVLGWYADDGLAVRVRCVRQRPFSHQHPWIRLPVRREKLELLAGHYPLEQDYERSGQAEAVRRERREVDTETALTQELVDLIGL